jgi:hypothetical protein
MNACTAKKGAATKRKPLALSLKRAGKVGVK